MYMYMYCTCTSVLPFTCHAVHLCVWLPTICISIHVWRLGLPNIHEQGEGKLLNTYTVHVHVHTCTCIHTVHGQYMCTYCIESIHMYSTCICVPSLTLPPSLPLSLSFPLSLPLPLPPSHPSSLSPSSNGGLGSGV